MRPITSSVTRLLAASSLAAASAIGVGVGVAGAVPPGPPSVPQNVQFFGGKNLIAAYWDAPASSGASAITQYRLCSTAPTTSCQYVPSTARGATLSSLTQGTSYDVKVEAISAKGISPAATGTQTPGVIPNLTTGIYVMGAPVNQPGSTTTVQYSPPSSEGGYPVTTYNIRQTDELPSGYDVTQHVAPSGSAPYFTNFTGQVDDVQYKTLVSATNAQGTSLNSAVVYYDLNHDLSGANLVKSFQVRVGDNYVTPAWAKTAKTGGSNTIGYDVVVKDNSNNTVGTCYKAFAAADGSWCTVSGLPTGTGFKVGVRAVTEAGNQPWSYDQVATTYPTSATPVNLSSDETIDANGVVNGLKISWDPGPDGYDQVQNYTVCIPNIPAGCQTVPRDVHSVVFSGAGISAGNTYPVSIFPTNIAGATAKFNAAFGTPPGQPGAPHLIQTDGGGTLSWTAPSSSGSSAIDGYKVTVASASDPTGTVACTTSGALSCSLTGVTLVDGVKYEAVISAHNSYGWGTPQATITWTQRVNNVGAPQGLYLNSGSKYITVQWTSLNVPAGKTLKTGTTATLTNLVDGTTATCTASTKTEGVGTSYYCTVTPLTNGAAYSVTIRNSFTDNTSSNVSNAVIGVPYKRLMTPHSVSAVRSNAGGTLNVSWLPNTWYRNRGPIFAYDPTDQYTVCINGSTCHDVSTSTYSDSFTVDPGTAYTVTVAPKSDAIASASLVAS